MRRLGHFARWLVEFFKRNTNPQAGQLQFTQGQPAAQGNRADRRYAAKVLRKHEGELSKRRNRR
jgi:hypothetical protein